MHYALWSLNQCRSLLAVLSFLQHFCGCETHWFSRHNTCLLSSFQTLACLKQGINSLKLFVVSSFQFMSHRPYIKFTAKLCLSISYQTTVTLLEEAFSFSFQGKLSVPGCIFSFSRQISFHIFLHHKLEPLLAKVIKYV